MYFALSLRELNLLLFPFHHLLLILHHSSAPILFPIAFIPTTVTVPTIQIQIATQASHIAAPTIFSYLPPDMETASCSSASTSCLKTLYFKRAFSTL
jgi:hypothetical protein